MVHWKPTTRNMNTFEGPQNDESWVRHFFSQRTNCSFERNLDKAGYCGNLTDDWKCFSTCDNTAFSIIHLKMTNLKE